MVKETAKEVGEFLNQPAESAISLGPLAFLEGLSLWIVIPIILFLLGAGIWFVLQILPFLVSAAVMFTFYYLFDKFGVKEPWKIVGPIIFGAIALVPAFVPQVRPFIAGQVYSTAVATGATTQAGAQGLISGFLDLTTKTFLAIPVVAVLIFLIIGLKALLDLGSPGAFFAGFLGIALGLGLGLHVVGASGMGLTHPNLGVGASYKFSEVSKGKITDQDTVWRWDSTPLGAFNDSHWRAEIVNTWKHTDDPIGRTTLDGKVKVTYRWISKAKISTSRRREAYGERFSGQWAKISVDPPTFTYRSESGKPLSQTPYELTRAKVTYSGSVSGSGGAVKGDIKLTSISTKNGSGTIKITAIFEKTVTKRKNEKVKNPGGGTGEGKGPAGELPMWAWVVGFASVVPAGFVYVGQEERWW